MNISPMSTRQLHPSPQFVLLQYWVSGIGDPPREKVPPRGFIQIIYDVI